MHGDMTHSQGLPAPPATSQPLAGVGQPAGPARRHLSSEQMRPSKLRPSCRETMTGWAPRVGLLAGAFLSRASSTTCALVTTRPLGSMIKPEPLLELVCSPIRQVVSAHSCTAERVGQCGLNASGSVCQRCQRGRGQSRPHLCKCAWSRLHCDIDNGRRSLGRCISDEVWAEEWKRWR